MEAQRLIELGIGAKISVPALASQTNMSERSFSRRFRSETGNTPSEYVQRVKVEQAKQMLEAGTCNVKEISYRTGYEDLNFFRRIFKRYTGLTQVEYKRMFA